MGEVNHYCPRKVTKHWRPVSSDQLGIDKNTGQLIYIQRARGGPKVKILSVVVPGEERCRVCGWSPGGSPDPQRSVNNWK